MTVRNIGLPTFDSDVFDRERMNLIIRLIEQEAARLDSQITSPDLTGYAPLDHSHTASDITDLLEFAQENLSLTDLSDVSAGSPSEGDVLTFDGTSWVAEAFEAGTLEGLSDVEISSPDNFDLLVYHGGRWLNLSPDVEGFPFLPTEGGTMTGEITMATNIAIQFGLGVEATLLSNGGELILNSGVPIEFVDGSDPLATFTPGGAVTLAYNGVDTFRTALNSIQFWNGTAWETVSAGVDALDDLTDVVAPAPQNFYDLRWVDANSRWEAKAPSVWFALDDDLAFMLDEDNNIIQDEPPP